LTEAGDRLAELPDRRRGAALDRFDSSTDGAESFAELADLVVRPGDPLLDALQPRVEAGETFGQRGAVSSSASMPIHAPPEPRSRPSLIEFPVEGRRLSKHGPPAPPCRSPDDTSNPRAISRRDAWLLRSGHIRRRTVRAAATRCRGIAPSPRCDAESSTRRMPAQESRP